MSEENDKPTTIIPDFFYDIICRIVPGVVFVALYWPKWICAASSAILVAWVILAAWVIGFTLDKLTFAVCYFFLKWISTLISNWLRTRLRPWEWLAKRLEGLFPKPKCQVYSIKLPAERRSVLRNLAEKVFFRIMAFISVCVVFWRPPALPSNHNNQVYGGLGIIAFSVCWYMLHLQVKGHEGFYSSAKPDDR